MMSCGPHESRPWALGEEAAEPIVGRAVEGGITFYDTADVYREEEREMIPQCIDPGVAVLPRSPLARGLLAGNRTREGERLTTRARTDSFGDRLSTPEVDFAVVARAAEQLSLDAGEIALLEEPYLPHAVAGHS